MQKQIAVRCPYKHKAEEGDSFTFLRSVGCLLADGLASNQASRLYNRVCRKNLSSVVIRFDSVSWDVSADAAKKVDTYTSKKNPSIDETCFVLFNLMDIPVLGKVRTKYHQPL